jgi:hypothetical protein
MAEQTGWIRNDDAVEAYTEKLVQAYGAASVEARDPSLKGHWQRLVDRGQTNVLAQTFEAMVYGTNKAAEMQYRGTCVSRGTFRAIQDAYYYEIGRSLVLGRKADLCFEPIYGGSRVNIGRGQLGSGDGSCGAWAAEFVAVHGVVERGVYGSVDLGRPNEDLAVLWGEPRRGCPDAVLRAGAEHLVASHRVYDMGSLADVLSAGYFAAYCSGLLWGDRDANGMARPSSRGGHCEEISGVFLLPNGQTAFAKQQSWGDQPRGCNVLRTAGAPITLRQGSYGVYASDLQRGLDEGGECWAFKLLSSFR